MPRQMWRKFFALFVLVFPVFLFVAQGKTLLLDDSDDNSHICLYVGDTLTIKLPTNPTTGYSWGQPQGGAHLELLSSKQEQGATDRAGAPGFQIFSFKATDTGVSTLTLNYFRPFEKDTPPVKTFLLSLTIEPRPFVAQNPAGTP
jgi:inhibitor of cysteine peptidase